MPGEQLPIDGMFNEWLGPIDDLPVATRIGGEVFSYFAFEKIAGYPLPSPDNPNDVALVMQSVGMRAGLPLETVQLHAAEIQALMSELQDDPIIQAI